MNDGSVRDVDSIQSLVGITTAPPCSSLPTSTSFFTSSASLLETAAAVAVTMLSVTSDSGKEQSA